MIRTEFRNGEAARCPDSTKRQWSVLIDFDGTLVKEQVLGQLQGRFRARDIAPLDAAFRSGELAMADYVREMYSYLRATPEELCQVALAIATPRPGIQDLVRFCRDHAIELRVVSLSLDTYLLPILLPLGFTTSEIICARARFAARTIIAAAPESELDLDFKATIVEQEQRKGRDVVFVGDGSADRAAAKRARFVFARRILLDYCREECLPHAPFEDFHRVRNWLVDSLKVA